MFPTKNSEPVGLGIWDGNKLVTILTKMWGIIDAVTK
jgi:hypothetical protein